MRLVAVADHAEHAAGLRRTVDRERGVENLVPTVFTIGLRKHHQLDIGRISLQLREGLHQVIDLVIGQRQTKLDVGLLQRCLATLQHIHLRQRRGPQFRKKRADTGTVIHHTLGHAVMQQVGNLLQLHLRQIGLTQQAGLERDSILQHALHAAHSQRTVVRDVGGFGSPGRDRAQARRNHNQGAVIGPDVWLTVGQECCQLIHQRLARRRFGAHEMDKARSYTADALFNGSQARQKLLDTKGTEGAAALECCDVQGHFGA